MYWDIIGSGYRLIQNRHQALIWTIWKLFLLSQFVNTIAADYLGMKWTIPNSKFMGKYGAHLGPIGPRWAPYWPHEPCYLGLHQKVWYQPSFHKNKGWEKCVYFPHTDQIWEGQILYEIISICFKNIQLNSCLCYFILFYFWLFISLKFNTKLINFHNF